MNGKQDHYKLRDYRFDPPPTMSDALPITPDQIATQAIDAAKAGAAILHLHARDPKDGRPSSEASVFMQFLPRIKQATDAVVNITTGGAVTMTVDQRISAANTLSPEMCSMNMGSINFASTRWRSATRPGNTIGRRAISPIPTPKTSQHVPRHREGLQDPGEGHSVRSPT